MSRSNYKFISLYDNDLVDYYSRLVEKKYKIKNINYKGKTINIWNLKKFKKIYQGRYNSTFKIHEFHLGLKFGALTKTRKPFFFRGKKKR